MNETAEQFETLSELVEGQSAFDSHGYSTVKVTKNGKEKKLRVPIKSTGIAELQEELRGKAPVPPKTFEIIKKGSPEGREAGFTHDRKVVTFDMTDEAYVNALERHNQDFMWKITIAALNVSWKKMDGSTAQSFDERKKILKDNGITDHQCNRIYKDVLALTQFAEDRQDFLSGN